MRISYIGPLPPIPGGIAQHGSHLATALQRAGHEVSTWSWKSQYPRWLYKGQQADPEATSLPGTSFVLRWWSPASWIRVARRARHDDLVVLAWVTPFHAIPIALMLALIRRTASLCIVHNVLPHERLPFDRSLTRLAIGRSDCAVVHSEAQRDSLSDLLPHTVSRVIPMPPHLRAGSQSRPPARPPFRLIQPGFVRPYKGVDTALRGLRLYLDRNPTQRVLLSIVGDFWDPTAEDTRALVASLGLDESVKIEDGYLSDDSMMARIESHHAGLLPYSSATQSGLIPAILGAGRPVITTDVGGLAEQVRDGIDAIVCPPDNASAIADALEQLHAHYEKFQGAAAKSWTGKPWDSVAQEVVEFATSDHRFSSPG